ncbi:MAG TPA: TetR/AcrR family transcriptional regulator [Acidimicrobiales bacterium]|nr:TetR/AcrR family transcriptional regulator [Acidimicrobiales bacterium]
MSAPPPDESSARRDELLDGAVAWTIEHGLADLSLRPLAKALGTSDRMLLYYFGTKDDLVAAIVDRAADGLAAALELVLPELSRSPKAFVDGIWGLLTDPAAQGVVDLFLELFVLTRRRGEPYRSASSRVVARWIELATPALVSMGLPARQAPGVVAAALAQLDGGILLAAAGATDAQLAAVRTAAVATIEAARR